MKHLNSTRCLSNLTVLAATFLAFTPQGMVAAQAVQSAPFQSGPVQAISAADKTEGAKAHPQLIAEYGGSITGPQANYVQGVGKNIAVQSGLSNARGDFTVTLLNSSVNNAFAIPGGYIYVTRQLVGLMNNEAELAAVLGHEVGHVAAQHAKKRQSAATRNSILGVLGTVLSGVILGNGTAGQLGQKIFSQGSQLLTLSYSRSQETEADNLGIAYLGRARYDPRAMSTVLLSLANQNALDARLMGTSNQVPTWASTHPDPASRVRAALIRAGANTTGITNRDGFLRAIDGIMYGDDPHQGIVEGRKFIQPDMRLAFEAPSGFSMVNGTRSVSIRTLTEQGQAKVTPSAIQRTTINGIPAAYGNAQVQGSSGLVDVVVFAYEFSKAQAFHFVTISTAGSANQFNSMFSSMRRVTASEAAAVRPRKLVVVTAKAGDTLQSLSARMAYSDAAMERFLVLNALNTNSRIVPGQKVKIVTY
jgi:predicted Zn-dependent protease